MIIPDCGPNHSNLLLLSQAYYPVLDVFENKHGIGKVVFQSAFDPGHTKEQREISKQNEPKVCSDSSQGIKCTSTKEAFDLLLACTYLQSCTSPTLRFSDA